MPPKPGTYQLVSPNLADTGQPAQRTRQMQKELNRTLLKLYEEAKTLEKRKNKDIKKEK